VNNPARVGCFPVVKMGVRKTATRRSLSVRQATGKGTSGCRVAGENQPSKRRPAVRNGQRSGTPATGREVCTSPATSSKGKLKVGGKEKGGFCCGRQAELEKAAGAGGEGCVQIPSRDRQKRARPSLRGQENTALAGRSLQ